MSLDSLYNRTIQVNDEYSSVARPGFLIWITGLSGSGKTTLGESVHRRLRTRGTSTILLDGDSLRAMTGDVFGYAIEDRRRCAEFYFRLCKMLTEQNVNVICCTISMFDSVRKMNRETISRYLEVFLNAPMDLLKLRDQKQLYTQSEVESNVMGRGQSVELPKHCDLSFDLGAVGLDSAMMTDRLLGMIAERGWETLHDQVQY